LWTHWRALFFDPLSYYQWLHRYCIVHQTEWGPKVMGVQKLTRPELVAKIKARFRRKLFKDVHGGDEPLVWNVVPLDAGKVSREAAGWMRRHKKLAAELQKNATTLAECEEPLATLRRLTADTKAAAVARYVQEWLEDNPGRKVLVLGYHRDALDWIAERLAPFGVTVIVGGMTDAARGAAREAFHGLARVCVGQIGACGVAIDLSAADYVVMGETVWTPGDNVQAAMRAQHRDKKAAVPVDVLVLAGSLDEAVERVKVRKLRTISDTYGEE
jgi:ERCC4-related helicase